MRPLSLAQRHIVSRLLTEGFSRAEIVRRTGFCPSTVARLARGQRRPRRVPVPDDAPPGYDPDRVRRCPGCGGNVYLWPCLKCLCEGRLEVPEDFRRRRRRRRKKTPA
jgi:hypothetical protein